MQFNVRKKKSFFISVTVTPFRASAPSQDDAAREEGEPDRRIRWLPNPGLGRGSEVPGLPREGGRRDLHRGRLHGTHHTARIGVSATAPGPASPFADEEPEPREVRGRAGSRALGPSTASSPGPPSLPPVSPDEGQVSARRTSPVHLDSSAP